MVGSVDSYAGRRHVLGIRRDDLASPGNCCRFPALFTDFRQRGVTGLGLAITAAADSDCLSRQCLARCAIVSNAFVCVARFGRARAVGQGRTHSGCWLWAGRWFDCIARCLPGSGFVWCGVELAALRCPWASIRQGDMWKADWSQYDMVYLFQRPETMPRAIEKARAELRPGTWLVSLEFVAEDIKPTAKLQNVEGKPVWLYRAPLP
jgi:hypothetical protein